MREQEYWFETSIYFKCMEIVYNSICIQWKKMVLFCYCCCLYCMFISLIAQKDTFFLVNCSCFFFFLE